MGKLSNNKLKQNFFDNFSELFTLYEEVKEIVLLAEYENKDRSYIISSVNELRNAFDHVGYFAKI